MKNIKITKRDLKFFFLGLLVFLIMDLIWNWSNAKRGFMEGYHSADSTFVKK